MSLVILLCGWWKDEGLLLVWIRNRGGGGEYLKCAQRTGFDWSLNPSYTEKSPLVHKEENIKHMHAYMHTY